MPPFLRFLISRLVSIPVTLFVITAVLYGFVMLTPPEVRASLYLTAGASSPRLSEAQIQRLLDNVIQQYHLRDPYPVQYAYWAMNLLKGNWGYSPVLHDDVLDALLHRTPVTAELTLYSLVLFIPLGLVSGVLAGWKRNRSADMRFRFSAFMATSLPVFILALILMGIFYVGLGWFAPERLSIRNAMDIRDGTFLTYTGLLTIDGFLNGRPDIAVDAARHLVMPVFTLSLLHWATLGRVTRASMIEELQKDYILAGKARGIPDQDIIWKHALRNVLSPALTSSALSAAALFTGVFVIEVIYNFKGISELVVIGTLGIPDAPTVLGFAIYSVIIVLALMFILDVMQAIFDPRVREGILHS